MDNLNTHSGALLYKSFQPAQARVITADSAFDDVSLGRSTDLY